MAWARTLADMAPKNSRPLIFFMAITIVSLSGAIVLLAKEKNNDNKNEADRWRVRAEVLEKKVADCEVGIIQHMMQDRINDSIEKVYSRMQVERLQNKIDTLKSLIR